MLPWAPVAGLSHITLAPASVRFIASENAASTARQSASGTVVVRRAAAVTAADRLRLDRAGDDLVVLVVAEHAAHRDGDGGAAGQQQPHPQAEQAAAEALHHAERFGPAAALDYKAASAGTHGWHPRVHLEPQKTA